MNTCAPFLALVIMKVDFYYYYDFIVLVVFAEACSVVRMIRAEGPDCYSALCGVERSRFRCFLFAWYSLRFPNLSFVVTDRHVNLAGSLCIVCTVR